MSILRFERRSAYDPSASPLELVGGGTLEQAAAIINSISPAELVLRKNRGALELLQNLCAGTPGPSIVPIHSKPPIDRSLAFLLFNGNQETNIFRTGE